MRFKIDENLPREVADLLREAGHDALTVHEQGMAGAADADIGAICQTEERCIVTLDLDFAVVRKFRPKDYAGIIALRLSRTEKPFVLGVMQDVIANIEEQDLAGVLWIVDDTRIRIRRLDH